MVEVRKCDAGYGTTPVLSELSFSLSPGETLAVVGSSGVGKSTLLLLLSGLKTPTHGGVLLDGESVRSGDRRIGLVLQHFGLFPWFTVGRNIGLGLEMQGAGETDRDRLVSEALGRFGLSGLGHRFPKELSGGQQQRVALARTLVMDPSLLLLDEPFSSLDALTREELQDFLLQLLSRRRNATVIVTHSIEEAVYLGTRIGILAPGYSASRGMGSKGAGLLIFDGMRTSGPDSVSLSREDPRFFEACTRMRSRFAEALGA